MTHYEHRQPGKLIGIALGATTAAFLLLSRNQEMGYWPWFVTGILLAVAILFSSLSIRIADGNLQWQFGPGLIKKQVPLNEISSVEITRTRFWEGWGIRITGRGWLYNVSGHDAVLIRLKSGKQFMLGTDQPAKLEQALTNTISTSQP